MSLFTPNTDFYINYYDKGKYIMAWRISLAFVGLFVLLFGYIVAEKSFAEVKPPIYFAIGIAVASLLFLKFLKTYKVTFWIYIIIITSLVHLALNQFEKSTHFVDFIWMISSVLLAFIGLNKKTGLILVGLNVLALGYFYKYSIDDTLFAYTEMTQFEKVGEFIEILFSISVITYLLYQFVVFHSVSQHESKATSNENTVLVKEIHHRVKNNLQIVISLLRLQQNELKSEEAKQHFSEAINRIMVMSLIHQKLYQDKSLAEIKIKDYLSDLTSDIASLSTLGISIKVDIKSELEKVGLKTIVPLGLIVNELMSNSIEHAFKGKNEALIHISIKIKDNNKFELLYFDNGSWNKKSKEYSSFGLELIETLTAQLDGKFKRDVSINGTSYEFVLNNVDLENN